MEIRRHTKCFPEHHHMFSAFLSLLRQRVDFEDSSYPIQEGLILNSHIFNLLTLDKGRSDCVYWIELDPIGLNGARRGKVLVLGIEVDLHCPC